MNHGFAVGRDLHVGLDTESAVDGSLKGGRGVLDRIHAVMQATVCDRTRNKPIEVHASGDLEHAFDLDGSIHRKHCDADRGAGVTPLVAECRYHQVRSAVHHPR